MHYWGDGWEYWDKLDECVSRCCELAEQSGLPVMQIKEKYGSLRFYIGNPNTEEFKAKYRKVYETLVAEFPMIKHEIMGDADWFREYLVGIVPEDECDHKGRVWGCVSNHGKEQWCGTCGKDIPEREQND